MIAAQAMTTVMRGVPATAISVFVTGTLILLGLAIPCFALAWDGLVRRKMLLYAFPVRGALGDQARVARRIWAFMIGLLCLVAGLTFLLLAWGSFLVAFERRCQGHGSLACVGALAGSAEAYAWAWFGGCVLWFLIVWLRMGDPRKRVLVYGMWYHQDKVAREVNRQLQTRGLAPLPDERLYALEEAVLRLMRTRGWLVYGDTYLDGGRKRTPVEIPPDEMAREALREKAFQGLGESERMAITLLLADFQAQARRAEHMSRLHRWWVGGGQRGKLGVYGRRTI